MIKLSGVQEWHEKGYRGQGIRVMVAEPDPNNYHAKSVAEIIKMYAPDCEVIMYDYNDFKEIDMADFAIKNKIDIINTSYGINYPDSTFIETRAREQYKRICDAGILVVNSAGNEGKGTIKDNGLMDDRIINVGMVTKELEVPIESSYGNGIVDCGGLVGHKLKDGSVLWGTSEAAPYVSGLLACLLSKEMLTYKQVMMFIGKNSIPVDERVGYGLFMLPSFANPLAVGMIKPNGRKIFVHKDYAKDKAYEGYKIDE